MDTRDTVTTMSSLLAMNEASVKLYDEAIQKLQDQQDIRNTFQQFRQDHQHHVEQIQNWFRQTGQRQQQPAEEAQNFAQCLLQDVRMARGRDEVLKSMTIGEAYDNAKYGECLQYDMQQQTEVTQMLQQQLQMEHHHWQYVEQHSPLKVMASAGMMGGMQGGTGYGGMGGQTGGMGGQSGGTMGGGGMGGQTGGGMGGGYGGGTRGY